MAVDPDTILESDVLSGLGPCVDETAALSKSDPFNDKPAAPLKSDHAFPFSGAAGRSLFRE